MDETETFDFAQAAFRHEWTAFRAANYLAKAIDYFRDEMIGEETFIGAASEVQQWLANMEAE